MKSLKNISIKPILVPLCYLYLLSLIYNFVFLMGSMYLTGLLFFIFEIGMGLISSIGFYWLCLKIWKMEGFNKNTVLKVLTLELFYLFICLVILQPLASMDNLLCQVIGLIFMVSMIPVQLIYFHGLAIGKQTFKSIFSYIGQVLKKENRSITNKFCVCLLIVLLLDTLSSGMMSAANGINTCSLCTLMILYGNPLMSGMVFSFFALSLQLEIIDLLAYAGMYLLLAICYGLIDVNYILFIKRKSTLDES